MAEVYLAEQPSLQRHVAIKVLRSDLAAKPDYVRRFQNEARAVAALVHANIVQIYEVGFSDGIHFIAQEYVPGQNLKQCITRLGPLPTHRVVSILRQIAAALSRAAQRSIVHRDIKPENILLMPGGEVKVADFGLARVVDAQQVDLTQIGLTMGTPLYMSPEQVEGKSLDHRSDLYACGATAFYMLTGRPPFQGDTPLSVAIQHLQNMPPDLAELRPDVPSSLRDIVQKLLAKKPQDRYATATELLRDLRALPLPTGPESYAIEEETQPWDVTSAPPVAALEATQQLQILLQTQTQPVVRRSSKWKWIATLGIATLAGSGLALMIHSPSALNASHRSSKPIEKASAESQFYYAMGENTPDAWRSVALYHPPEQSHTNRYYASRALEKLAYYHLDRNELDQAEAVYQEMTKLSEGEFRAMGFAGLAIVSDRRNAPNFTLVEKAMEDREKLPTYLMESLLRIADQPKSSP